MNTTASTHQKVLIRRDCVLCCCYICFALLAGKCFAQEHLVYVGQFNSLISSELQEAISAVGKRDFNAAEALLDSMKLANREPKVNLSFVSAVISYEKKEYRTVIAQCSSILDQAPTAIQASDLMCLAAATKGMPIDIQLAALQKSVECHQDCFLIQALPPKTQPSDSGVALANELLIGRPQLKMKSEEANEKIKELLAMLLSEGPNKVSKRITLESNLLPNTTHHYYRDSEDHAVLYLRPSKSTDFDEVLLRDAFYELLNIDNKSQFYSLQRAAMSGEITEEEFCIHSAKLEFLTFLKLRQFYSGHVSPIMKQHAIETAPANWALGRPGQFKAYMSSYPIGDWYPWKYYGAYYQQIVRFGYWHLRPHLPNKAYEAGVELQESPN